MQIQGTNSTQAPPNSERGHSHEVFSYNQTRNFHYTKQEHWGRGTKSNPWTKAPRVLRTVHWTSLYFKHLLFCPSKM